ncbi:MAG: NAD(P)H-binding protein [Archangium sp.]|nr:NAD(P)H-binding protein [Archangium sp.]
MKLVVLGASGGCGAQLVAQAKAKGHEVTAVVRSSTWQPPAGVRVERGDLANEAFLRQAVRGADAVASALGLRLAGIAPWHQPEQPDFLSRSTPALISALKAEGVRRIIAISAGGVGDSRDRMPLFFKLFIKLSALKRAYAELEVMERLLLDSGLEVSIPRPSGLTDESATGAVKIVESFKGRGQISRADVAGWMLAQLEQPQFSSPRTPIITVTGA